MGALMPWRPFRELERMSRLFDRMFREAPWPAELEEEAGAYAAPVECLVKDNNLVVRADVPGMEPKDIDVSLLGNVLTIKGERKSKEEAKKGEYLRREIAYGAFERRLTVPEGVQADKSRQSSKTASSRLRFHWPRRSRPRKSRWLRQNKFARKLWRS
jgi:HSP20 family protein